MKMKRQAIIYMCLLLIGAIFIQNFEDVIVKAEQPVVIPDEAIRLRILANSDSKEDQALKRKIRNEVNKEITRWVEDLTSIEKARTLINSRLPMIEAIIEQVLAEEGIAQSYQVDFGKVSFPTKMYGNYVYPAGKYEAILISLGEAKGANWWCVLFPPLCFLDFSNGDAVKAAEAADKADAETEEANENEENKVEVKFFVVEFFTKLIDKLF